MRSSSAVAGALACFIGVLVALIAASVLEDAAETIIHFALAASFALFARSAFDFGTPRWLSPILSTAIGGLAVVFSIQGAALLFHSPQLRHFAYDVLGQRLEKILGYAFLIWCVLVAVRSAGISKLMGVGVLAAVLYAEIIMAAGGASETWKLLYLPLFAWLLIEGAKPTRPRPSI